MKEQFKKNIVWIVTIAILILNVVIVFGKANEPLGKIAQKVSELKSRGVFTNEVSLFSIVDRIGVEDFSSVVSNYTLFNINSRIADVVNYKPEYIKLMVPVDNGSRNLSVLLYKVDISPNGFTLITSSGKQQGTNAMIVNYRGSIEGDDNSVAAITFSENETMGLISSAEGDYVLGRIERDNSNLHMIYNDNDLVPHFNFECGTNTSGIPENYSGSGQNSPMSVKCVNWYWEVDNDIYNNKGHNVDTVAAYMNGIFNQVSTLYANDGMSITLQTLFVWDTTDPYTGPTTSDYLTQFGNYRTSFAGDLATLIGYAGGGGIAWINGLCNSQTKYKQSYCGISSSYQAVPTYSWTVEVVSHEEGHLFGSRHTHDCVWNGNNTAIDGCGDAAGYPGSGSCADGPIPTKGTIMSYCHLSPNPGINLALGFGPQPTTIMLNNENNAACLSACCAGPAQPGTITGATSVCQTSSQTYSISAVSGATSYTWTLPSGWSGSSTSTSITATAGSTSGSISVVANSSCGSSAPRTLSVTISPVPAQPGSISGATSVCQSSFQTYSVSAVSGATSYTWTLPSGWSGSSTTNSINSTAGSSGGSISVTANNACGSSIASTLSVTTSSTPAQPGTISGVTSVCALSSQTYSVGAVSGATSYTWTLPSGWTGSSTTNSITTTAGSSGGSISVTANNACGSSIASTLSVTTSSTPAQPGTISGVTSVCALSSQTYSVGAVSGATSYTWTLPPGWTGSSTTNSITATAGSTGGSISVAANNACGSSIARTATVTISSLPAQPGTISGVKTGICNLTNVSYSVPNVAGMTYNWSFSTGGATIASGQGTRTISVNFTSAFTTGSLDVTASNACGVSLVRSATIKSIPAAPASITGSVSVCANQQVVPYSTDVVAGAANYTWVGPNGSHISDGITTSSNKTLITTATSVTVNYSNSSGSLKVRANNTCGSSLYRIITVSFVCRDGEPLADENVLTAYPNPAHDKVTVSVLLNDNTCRLKLSDLSGRELLNVNRKGTAGLNNYELDIRNVSKGIYLLEVQSGNINRKTKIIVE